MTKSLYRILMIAFLALSLLTSAPQKSYATALSDTAHYNGLILALNENWVASLMMMTEQFTTTMMMQMMIVGSFLDAQQNLETIRLFRELVADAHKDLHSSYQMCVFGTGVRSLASADIRSDANARIIDQVLEKRELLTRGLSAAGGIFDDSRSRIAQFKETYCDLAEIDGELDNMCNSSSGPVGRRTNDVDYSSLIGNKYTLDANYTDMDMTDTEEDIIALGRNLYASEVIDFIPSEIWNEETTQDAAQSYYLETRSVHAIRSVARNSFAEIVGMKAEGEEGTIYESAPFIKAIIEELGVPDTEINDFLGENPSYYAQMEVLTKKIYQSPEFYTNLYDKPNNVRRIGVALQALEIMQNRDRYEASLRREMLISLMAELRIRRHQEAVNTAIFNVVSDPTDTVLQP